MFATLREVFQRSTTASIAVKRRRLYQDDGRAGGREALLAGRCCQRRKHPSARDQQATRFWSWRGVRISRATSKAVHTPGKADVAGSPLPNHPRRKVIDTSRRKQRLGPVVHHADFMTERFEHIDMASAASTTVVGHIAQPNPVAGSSDSPDAPSLTASVMMTSPIFENFRMRARTE